MTDEELMAFVDGELDAPARERAAAAIAADPLLAARVRTQQALRARLQQAFDPILDEPLPQSLRALADGVAAPAPVANLEAARARREERLRPRWSWRESSAIAATLVMGVMLGAYVMRASQELPLMSEDGRIVAIGSLRTALTTQLSGAAPRDGTTIGMSFRTANGQYCRTFAMNTGPAGLACREQGDWVVEVLARDSRPRIESGPGSYRQAGTAFPDAIRQAVEARIEGDPLDVGQEAELAEKNW